MKRYVLATLTALAVALTQGQAAISVGATGTGLITLDSAPTDDSQWATAVLNGTATTYVDVPGLDAGVQGLDAGTVVRVLPTSGTVPPSTFSGGFRYNTTALYIQSRPTTDGTNAASVLKATLQNDSGGPITTLNISYDYGAEAVQAAGTDELPGMYVYYSLTGVPGSWVSIPSLSGIETPGTLTASVDLSATPWQPGTPLYIVWVDDNDNSQTDTAWTLDNLVFSPGALNIPLYVTLTAPAANRSFLPPATVNATANAGGTTPPLAVEFYVNDMLIGSANTAPYTAQALNLQPGSYQIYARAYNASEVAFSTTNTFTVLPAYSYTGGSYMENFDGMGPTGTITPPGWYVGNAVPVSSTTVVVGDGSAAPATATLGWNYGQTDSPDRALGTAPTGADRNTVLVIQNNSGTAISAFQIQFDGEQWRTHSAGDLEVLTNYYSVDGGATWITTGFDWTMPVGDPVSSAVDGNTAGRVPGLGGLVVPPSPIQPGDYIYLRWENDNGSGTDGAMAIDNFMFTLATAELAIEILSPTNSQVLPGGCSLGNVTVTARATLATSVSISLDGGTPVVLTAPPYSTTFTDVAPGVHTITASATDGINVVNATPVTFTLTTSGTQVPTIAITNTFSGSVTGLTYLVGTPITNQLALVDDGAITNQEFFIDGVLYLRSASFQGTVIVRDPEAGTHTFTVRVTDSCGNIAVSAPLQVVVTNPPNTVLIPNGSLWKYYEQGSTNIDGEWYYMSFNDSSWPEGRAVFGFGDQAIYPERTLIARTNSQGFVNSSFFYRKTFTVANPAEFTGLILNVLRDDGARVYLNESEVWNTPATFPPTGATGDDGTVYYTTNIPASYLLAGANVIAVEVAQNSATSSDTAFDLMLWGVSQPAVAPTLNFSHNPDTKVLTLSWDAPGYVLQSAPSLDGPWTQAATTSPQTFTTGAGDRFFRLRQP